MSFWIFDKIEPKTCVVSKVRRHRGDWCDLTFDRRAAGFEACFVKRKLLGKELIRQVEFSGELRLRVVSLGTLPKKPDADNADEGRKTYVNG
jgi:hypothetical protein